MTVPTTRPRDDRGAATTQLVLVVPLVLLLTLLVVQFALAWHARHIAQYAAQRALAAARVEDGTAGDGRAQAWQSIDSLGPHILTRPAVTVDRNRTGTSVRVEGTVITVVPGVNLHVAGTASGPTERLTTTPGGNRL
ncbi:TadE/TadG family type IV pilus assembly protein [Actinacidiphila yeochonensis]|uniref:TadE/TadG family type IV pilus assembly protein n=1 Tax=Actinacidiphila yeochonensis TaxID=89050 RepID=UPI000569E878|nr:TadE/TadG family type IV pilus assembly protein [Actinacidiphila yeochonensis]